MNTVVLNVVTVMAAAGHLGVLTPEALAVRLGVPLVPVTAHLMGLVVALVPITLAEAFTVVECGHASAPAHRYEPVVLAQR